ncbi:MAG: UrcA family protein [Pseudomonadota bacterium]
MAQQMNRRLSTTLIGSVAGLLLAGAAQADISYSIKVSEKDFQNTAKVAELHKRIRRTAAEVCPSYFVSRGLAEVQQCRRDVEADLVSRIDHPVLTAYVNGERAAFFASADD